jgi:hypothetical protein
MSDTMFVWVTVSEIAACVCASAFTAANADVSFAVDVVVVAGCGELDVPPHPTIIATTNPTPPKMTRFIFPSLKTGNQ